jgi:maltooligosyltrehalose trehalohydrolase
VSERLRVWAPRARCVELELVDTDARRVLVPVGGGFYEGEMPSGRYQLVLDGDVVPDPRAAELETVHGPCRAVAPATFVWHDADFVPPPLADAVIYELHVGAFTEEGTFEGAAQRLSYLAELGITHVELMPVATFSGERNWGYDGAGLFAPQASYGGPDGLRRFVDAAHGHGLAVLLDVVYNHLGPIGNYLERFGPYFREGRGTAWGRALNFDGEGCDEVRRFFLDNAQKWLRDYHVDGLRLDAVQAIEDGSACHFLEELAAEVAQLGGRLGKYVVLIAESDLNDPRLIRARDECGYGLDAQWSDDFHHALHVLLTGEADGYYVDFVDAPLAKLARALTAGFVYDGAYSRYRDRRHGRPLGGLRLDRLLGYVQNHDQVGNRAEGDRLSQRCSLARVELALTLVLTAPFVPMLFMGEEWGSRTPFFYFTDHQDAGVAEAVRAGRRREHHGFLEREPPDPQARETFLRSKLRFAERLEPSHAAVLGHVRHLIALRRRAPELRDGRAPAVEFDEKARTLSMRRGRYHVVCNFSDRPVEVVAASGAEIALVSRAGVVRHGATFELGAEGAMVLVEPGATAPTAPG